MAKMNIKSSRSQELIDFACKFAEDAHASVNQKRKYTNEPYVVHPIEVAEIVAEITDDVNMICAALLHDVVEDTPVTLEEIRDAGFGFPVMTLVEQLTDVSKPEDGNRKTRKAIDREHTAQASPAAKTIKLADLISNTKSIVEHDPNFARVYMHEKRALLEHLTEGDSTLLWYANHLVKKYYESRSED